MLVLWETDGPLSMGHLEILRDDLTRIVQTIAADADTSPPDLH